MVCMYVSVRMTGYLGTDWPQNLALNCLRSLSLYIAAACVYRITEIYVINFCRDSIVS